MPVHTRQITSFSFAGLPCLGAVEREDDVLLALRAGFARNDILKRVPKEAKVFGAPQMPFVALADAPFPVPKAELEFFAGKTVLLAFRNGETAQATADWLDYHARLHGAEAALIVNRADPNRDDFHAALSRVNPDLDVVLVSTDQPLGTADGADHRHVSTAPIRLRGEAAPQNPWHAPLRDHGIYELLRWRFLSAARAVAFIGISDLLLPQDQSRSVFERCALKPGSALPLRGGETYPWRLRKGQAAPHSDHIARRRGERRVLLNWCLAPAGSQGKGLWGPGRPMGLPVSEPAWPFMRAMGVVYPAVPVNKLVVKESLHEDPELLSLMRQSFSAEPLRLPAPQIIAPRPPTHRVTVVTSMKNEGPFLLDWIAHNRAIGIDHHLVYTNDCEDGTDDLLSALSEAGVTHRANPYRETGQVPQYAAFRAASREACVIDADWLLTLDVDEFLNIHVGGGGVDDLLAAVPNAHAISVPWRMFGNAHRHQFEDRPVTDLFPLAAPAYAPRPLQAWAFKTLYRNAGLFRRLGVHRPKGLVPEIQDALIWLDACGNPIPAAARKGAWRMSKAQWGYDLATLNHYAVRTAESFLVKRERGKVNRTKREQGLAYWFRMNHNAIEERSIARLSERTAAQKAQLLALPKVAELHHAAVDWHRERIATLRNQPAYAAFYEQITSPRMEHLSKMATYFGANVHQIGPQVIPNDIAARDPETPFYWSIKLTGNTDKTTGR